MRYPSQSDAKRRLQNSIVRYKGEYFLCHINGDAHLSNSNTVLQKNYNNESIDVEAIHIGWVISEYGATYYARTPADSQNQGTRPDMCSQTHLGSPGGGDESVVDFLNNPISKGRFEYITRDIIGHKYDGFTLLYDKTNTIGILKGGVVQLNPTYKNKRRDKILGDHYGLPVK